MNYKEIVDLIKLVNKTDLTEVKIQDGEFKLDIRTKNYSAASKNTMNIPQPVYQQAPIQALPAEQPASPVIPDLKPTESKPASDANLLEVRSPIVGTFYRSASPDKPPYIKVGDSIEVGSVVCIVEAMKLFNEIESEVAGKIVKVVVEDASPVEYDQVLFLVDPS
ncbi:acetyl-CoA carboxylase biotin carboxyl carrier protein [Portibacter lacus]|uniref:Biotin carboxyl carrier protein of acetyl-CoA carboxylase n=1 Tax=Portibacter lacus TaxID=1099794 RepID=A0AA37WI15_9BACT|nr:acetyl-CoA carboxylase biotin carboxyl carrier protein [Portibacter lacus]GLR19170.1 acetyl-CoA carboxylase, biotin carboxyl carrier protein [Portibacter lacus]